MRGVDHVDGIAVVGILHVHGLAGFLGSKITAGRDQIKVVQVPNQRGPGVVEHPLNHPGGGVFVAAIGFEHGTLAVVGHGLSLALIVVEGSGFAVATI